MRNLSIAMWAGAALAFGVGAIVFACAVPPRETYRQIVAERQAPKIEGLAERASPDQRGETATESFWDLLKLRDQPAPAAVPEIAKILASHEGSTRIHRFAAAQALYAAGGDDARRTLEKHLLAPEFPADMALMYTSHWQMGEPERSGFIESYLLRDLTDDLGVSVQARWTEGEPKKGAERQNNTAGKSLVVTVTFANESNRVLAVLPEQHFQATSLQFRGPSGAFAPQMRFVVYGPLASRWQRLKPGGSSTIDAMLTVKDDPDSLRKARTIASDAVKIKALLSSTDTGFALSEFGKYQLSAMIVRMPLVDEQKKALREREGIEPQEIWMGRAVSKPVEVELSPPVKVE